MQTVTALVNAVFDAYERRDREECRALLHPEFRYESKLTPLLGLDAVTGREATLDLFLEHMPATFDEFSLAHTEMTELDADRLICGVSYRGRGRHSGAVVEQEFWKVFTVRDGTVLSMVEYESRADAIASDQAAAARA